MVLTVPLSPIQAPKISDTAYQILRQKVVSKEFAPGERLDLGAIEQQLGISRTPIKEALARLEMEGLVHIAPRSGTFVTAPRSAEILESFDVRRALEVHAIAAAVQRAHDEDLLELAAAVEELGRLAAGPDREANYPRYLELDHEFHRRIVVLAGNSRLSRAHERENVHAQMARIRYRSAERELNIAQQEHECILAALRARDAEAAKAEMDAHLRRAARSLLEDMGS